MTTIMWLIMGMEEMESSETTYSDKDIKMMNKLESNISICDNFICINQEYLFLNPDFLFVFHLQIFSQEIGKN